MDISNMCLNRLTWLKNNLFLAFKDLTKSLLVKIQKERSILDMNFDTPIELCTHNESLSVISGNFLEYPEIIKIYDELWNVMQELSIEVAPSAYDIITDIRRELRALKLQLTFCDRQQVQSEQEQCGVADLNLLQAREEAIEIMQKVERDSRETFATFSEANKFKDFLRHASSKMNSAKEKIMLCMRLKISYGRPVSEDRWELVFRFNKLLNVVLKYMSMILDQEKQVIFDNQDQYINTFNFTSSDGTDLDVLAKRNYEDSRQAFIDLNDSKLKIISWCNNHAQQMIDFLKVTRILQKSEVFKMKHWNEIRKFIDDKKLNADVSGNQFGKRGKKTFVKRKSLMGNASFNFRHSIRLLHVNKIVTIHLNKFYKLYENAMGEDNIKLKFDKSLNIWHETSFQFNNVHINDKGLSLLLLSNVEELKAKIDEGLVLTGHLMSSKYFDVISRDILHYRESIYNMDSSLTILLRNEKRLKRLGNMLSFEYASSQIPSVHERLKDTLKMWNRCAMHCNLLIDDLHYKLKNRNFNFEDEDFEVYESFVNIEKDIMSLTNETSSFVQEMRENFPRFYYLTNEEVIQAIASCINLDSKFEKYLQKLFPNVTGLKHDSTDDNNPIILSIESKHETLVLDRVLRLRREGLNIFSTLDKQMKSSIRAEVAKLGNLSQAELFSFEKFLVTALYEDFADVKASNTTAPIQVIIGVMNAKLFLMIENAFTDLENNKKDAFETLIEYVGSLKLHLMIALQDLLSTLSVAEFGISKIISSIRRRFGLLLECLVYHLNFIKILSAQASEIYGINSFLYYNKAKTFIKNADSGNKVEWNITCGSNSVSYGYEFTGDKASSLVLDNNSERAMCLILRSLGLCSTHLITDNDLTLSYSKLSIEQLSLYLGTEFVDWHANLGTDPNSTKQRLIGCMKTGGLLFLNGISNCAPAVLQMIASIVSIIQKALNGNSSYFDLHGHLVKPLSTFIFISTTSILKRKELSPTLKSQFATSYLGLPDKNKVCEILFNRAGYSFYNLNTGNDGSKDVHNDECYNLKLQKIRADVRSTIHDASNNGDNGGHWFFKVKNKIESLLSSLTVALNEQVNGATDIESTLEVLERKIGNLKFGDKAIQIYKSIESSTAVTICGPSKSGKSTIIDCLAKALFQINGKKINLWKIFPGAMAIHTLCRVVNSIETSPNNWIILDGEIKPYVLETLWAKIATSTTTQNGKMSLQQKYILETSDLQNVSPNHFYAFPNVTVVIEIFKYADYLKFWYEKMLKEKLSKEEIMLLDLLVSHFENENNFLEIQKYSKLSTRTHVSCLLSCLSILEISWKILFQMLKDLDAATVAARAYCYSITWGVGAAEDEDGRKVFSKYFLRRVKNFIKYFEPGEINEKDEDFTFFHFDLMPESDDVNENSDEATIIFDKQIHNYIFCMDNYTRNALFVRDLALKSGSNLLFTGGIENRNFKQMLLMHNMSNKKMYYIQKLKVSSYTDLPFSVEMTFDEHKKTLYDGRKDKTVLYFIEDLNCEENKPRDSSVYEILRSFITLSGYFHPVSLKMTSVRRYGVVLSTSNFSINKMSTTMIRFVDKLNVVNMDKRINSKDLFNTIMVHSEVKRATNNSSFKFLDTFEAQIASFCNANKKMLHECFDSKKSIKYLEYKAIARIYKAFTVEPSEDTNSLMFNFLNSLAFIQCPIQGIPYTKRLETVHSLYYATRDIRKLISSKSATVGSVIIKQNKVHAAIKNCAETSSKRNQSHSSVSLSTYLVSLSPTLQYLCTEIMEHLANDNLTIFCKDQHATLDHMIENACIATGKEFYCVDLGPIGVAENENLLFDCIGNAIVGDFKECKQENKAIIVSIANAQYIDFGTLQKLLSMTRGFQVPHLYRGNSNASYDKHESVTSFHAYIFSYMKEHVKEFQFMTQRNLYQVTVAFFNRTRLLLQVPYSERGKMTKLNKEFNIFQDFTVMTVPIISSMNKKLLVSSLLSNRLSGELSKAAIRKLSEVFMRLDDHYCSTGYNLYATYERADVLVLLESVECFVNSYLSNKKRLEIDRHGIETGIRQLIHANTVEKDIMLTLNQTKQKIEEVKYEMETLSSEKPKIERKVAKNEDEYVLQTKVLESLVHSHLGEIENLGTFVNESQSNFSKAVERVRLLNKIDFIALSKSKRITLIEAKILFLIFDILENKSKTRKPSEIKRWLQNSRFQSKIVKCKIDTLSSVLKASLKDRVSDLQRDSVQNCNAICINLMSWAVSLVEYIAALKQVIPLQHKIDLLEEGIISQKGIINAISSDIKELKEALLISEKTFLRRETDRDRLTASLVEHKQTYFNCNKIMSWLNLQAKQWDSDLSRLIKTELPSFVASIFVSFACLPYVSCMTPTERVQFRSLLPSVCNSPEIAGDNMFIMREDMEFGGLNEMEKHELEAAGMPRSFACCSVALDIIYRHGISILVDPQLCATKFLECALGADKLTKAFVKDSKIYSKLINAVINGLTFILYCEDTDVIPRDIWPFFSLDPGHKGNRVIINKKYYTVNEGFRMFVNMDSIPKWHYKTFHAAALINFTNNTMLPNRHLTARRQKLLISISMDMLERRQTQYHLLEMLSNKSFISLCKNDSFIQLVNKVLSTDRLLHDRLDSALLKLDDKPAQGGTAKSKTRENYLSRRKSINKLNNNVDFSIIYWNNSGTLCSVKDFMEYISLVENPHGKRSEELIFYIDRHENTFEPSNVDDFDQLQSVYIILEMNFSISQIEEKMEILKSIKEHVDHNVPWLQWHQFMKIGMS
eukprot:g6642.t1